ncbi:MAG: Sir2 family NAD-dependent protein deacetylase [Gammaproteobacteria bacterium]|nr:Sir2 family NAD-dependent protein deacetylase [Gammaproteobacteria bacterium]
MMEFPDRHPPEGWLKSLAAGRHVTVLSGAGLSADSGVRTFRDPQDGLWAEYRPEQLATPGAFAAAPTTVWQWYQWRRRAIGAAQPHAGYHALARLAGSLGWQLITQNVDGLHQRAGMTVLEFHGSIWKEHCQRCETPNPEAPTTAEEPPRCSCGGLFRPSVVWFGETLDAQVLQSAAAAMACDTLLLIGTSAQVYPAAALAGEARSRGATVLEMNPEVTPAQVDSRWCSSALEGLPTLAKALLG